MENSCGESDRKSDQNFQKRDGSRDYKKGYQFSSFYQVVTRPIKGVADCIGVWPPELSLILNQET